MSTYTTFISHSQKKSAKIRFCHLLLTVFCVASLVVAFQGTAQAYVDPGSGLLTLQILGSALAGVGFYFRQKFARLFMRRSTPAENSEMESSHPDHPGGSTHE